MRNKVTAICMLWWMIHGLGSASHKAQLCISLVSTIRVTYKESTDIFELSEASRQMICQTRQAWQGRLSEYADQIWVYGISVRLRKVSWLRFEHSSKSPGSRGDYGES
ncbi:hypothetical protein C8Q80DRAFT_1209849 [Daedaleopsis nitida]|nr:hypothetical protein C8Q80DRAFT_1209849 [Daedaleopsis nitida]